VGTLRFIVNAESKWAIARGGKQCGRGTTCVAVGLSPAAHASSARHRPRFRHLVLLPKVATAQNCDTAIIIYSDYFITLLHAKIMRKGKACFLRKTNANWRRIRTKTTQVDTLYDLGKLFWLIFLCIVSTNAIKKIKVPFAALIKGKEYLR